MSVKIDGASLNTPEPPPIRRNTESIWDLVIEAMRERDVFGRRKHGTPLQAFNDRDPLVDAFQESLDQSVYLRQEIEKRKKLKPLLAEICLIAATSVLPDGDHPCVSSLLWFEEWAAKIEKLEPGITAAATEDEEERLADARAALRSL